MVRLTSLPARGWAVGVVAAVAVAVMTGCAAVPDVEAISERVSGESPPPLHLRAEHATAAAGPMGGIPDVTIAGELPEGPDTGTVQRLPADLLPVDEVQRVAAALQLSGTPQRLDHGWSVGGGGRTLVAHDDSGWPWSYGPGLGTVGRVPAEPSPAPPAVPPSAQAAQAAAQALLDRLRLDSVVLHVLPADPAAGEVSVVADPVVAGLQTSGYSTLIVVDGAGQVRRASGWLGQPRPAQSYPLVDARTAVDRLFAVAPKPPCRVPACAPAQLVIVSAEPGLVLRHDEAGRAVLVPAWLYTARGNPLPLAAVALTDEWLGSTNSPGPPAGQVPGPAGSPTAGG